MLPKCMLLSPWEDKFSVLFIFSTMFSYIIFLTLLLLISPKLVRYQRCFIGENFSGGNITLRCLCREVFSTPKLSLIAVNIEFREILTSNYWQSSQIVCSPITDGRKNYFLIHLYICRWLSFQPEKWPVVLGCITVQLWHLEYSYMKPCKMKNPGVWKSSSI